MFALFIMHFGFEVPSAYRSSPDRVAKPISYIGDDNFRTTEITISKDTPIFYVDLLHFLKFLPQNSTTKDFNQVKNQKNIKTTRILMDNDQEILVKIDESELDKRGEGRAYLKFAVPEKTQIDATLFDIHHFAKKDLYIFKKYNYKDYTIDHPYRKIGKVLSSDNEILNTHIDQHLYSKSYHWKKQQAQFMEFYKEDFWEKFKGFKIFYLNQELDKGVSVNDSYLQSFIFINPSFKEIIKNSNFIELDASFALDPYAYSIPLCIINNESFPLGLSIGPSENHLLYSQIYDTIKNIDPDCYALLISKPVLSDEGGAIQKFCDLHQIMIHFYCFRHIIQKFGSSTKIGELVGKLLFISTKEKFDNFWNTQKEFILYILKSTTKANIVKFCKLFKCTYDPEEQILSDSDFDDQSIWERAKYGVATCSNHIESMHQKINLYTLNIRLFPKKLYIILNYMKERESKAHSRPNLKFSLFQLKRNIEKYNLMEIPHENCHENEFKSSLYGIEYPCQHLIDKVIIHPIDEFQNVDHECDTAIITDYKDYEQWIFNDEKTLTYNLTAEDKLFVENVGFPDEKKFKRIAKNAILTKTSEEDFLIKLFIHFCRIKYQTNYYYIHDPLFYKYILEFTNNPAESDSFLYKELNIRRDNFTKYTISKKILNISPVQLQEMGDPDYMEEEEEYEIVNSQEERNSEIEQKRQEGLSILTENYNDLINLLNN